MHCSLCLLCRCFVKQQDQAVKVHNPLLLLEHFEALVGTSGYVVSISEARQHRSDKHMLCEGLQSDVNRHGPDCPPPHFLDILPEADVLQDNEESPVACSRHISMLPLPVSGKILHLL